MAERIAPVLEAIYGAYAIDFPLVAGTEPRDSLAADSHYHAASLGERHLHRAHALGRVGRFQIEAAIQSVHCARATSGVTDWHALLTLHAALLSVAPTLGARVAYAAAVGRVEGARAGLEALDAIEDEAAQRFQPAWATRAHLLAEAGRGGEAVAAYERAISLTTDNRARRYLEQRRARLLGEGRG
jgi:RNA polymerase sigma-70 factor (ECF subfamily)